MPAEADEAFRAKQRRAFGQAKEGVVLVLSRKANQCIMIGSDIRILVVGIDRDQVKLGIEAPRDVPVYRFEIYDDTQRPVGNDPAEDDTRA